MIQDEEAQALTTEQAPEVKQAPEGKETKASKQAKSQADRQTQDDVLLDREALEVDTDEKKAKTRRTKAKKDNGQTAPSQESATVKPTGPDAESLAMQEIKTAKKSDFDIDDLKTPLGKMTTLQYLHLIMPLHVELLKMQNWIRESGQKLLVINEGRDAAGKGGTIKRFVEHMNPRGCRIVALDKPSDRERTQWFFQRYIAHLPSGGEVVFFDRSWYNRAVVERVMGFCNETQVEEFYQSVPDFERMLVRSGLVIVKFWFSVSRRAQDKRFTSRETDPRKQWKLSPVDKESQDRWEDYTRAKEDMFHHTSIPEAPWMIVKSDNKKLARINSMQYFLSQFAYEGRHEELLHYDRTLVRSVEEEQGID